MIVQKMYTPSSCLIVANDPWFIQLLTMYSEECGLRVIQAFDGQEVVKKASSEQPAAILLQMDLIGSVKSRELLFDLRQNPETSTIPVLVFSWQGEGDGNMEPNLIHFTEPVTYSAYVNTLQAAGISLPRQEEKVMRGAGGSRRRRNRK